jgi:hypothetical protein
MFGDGGWDEAATSAQRARFERWLSDAVTSAGPGAPLVIVECGAGTAVPTVRMIGEALAQRLGATLVRINAREADGVPGAIALSMGAREALAAIDDRLSRAVSRSI